MLSGFVVDTFTGPNLLGNPALICVAEKPLKDEYMRQISIDSAEKVTAAAFIWPEDNAYRIRSFSMGKEIRFCGHASLAACYVIFSRIRKDLSEAYLLTSHLKIFASFTAGRASMLVPAFTYKHVAITSSPLSFVQAPGIKDLYYGNDTFFMRLSSQEDVINFRPDIYFLKHHKLYLAVTAKGEQCDFVSRFFGPASGHDEDPVTGSAHCVLAPIWARILGKRSFIARQLSSGGGQLEIQLNEDRSSLTISGLTRISEQCMIEYKGSE